MGSVSPVSIPNEDPGFNISAFRESAEGKKIVGFFKSEYSKAKSARQTKQTQWYQNLSMFFGRQYAEAVQTSDHEGIRGKLRTPRSPYYRNRKTVNRTRSFVRTEHSKFLSSIPAAVAVPSTAEDEDIRAAYAGEQAWQSLSESGKLRKHFTSATWWMIITGNGFIKTWWDNSVVVDRKEGIHGNVRFGSVTPFHLFVPDLREQELQDQPLVINAYTKTVAWVKHYYAEELKGVNLEGSLTSANSILEEGYLNLSTAGRKDDSVLVYECWAKPGATPLLPNGGMAVIIEDTLVSIHRDGLPYTHEQYPFTKFEHIPTSTFYADSPLVDTNNLQREFNQLRTEISEAGRRMAKPQLVAQRGSIVAEKVTNEPGSIIMYNPGTPAPQPIPLSPLPAYYVSQQDRVLADWEDITGQREVSKGSAPAGITSGTAINFLQEKANQYLTPQYQSLEDGYEAIAQQTLSVFVQYVDMPRKIKTIGLDGAFDTVLLSGSDIASGTDIRIQKGSSVGESQAAKQAKIMDMFAAGLIADPNQALKLLEIGGAEKVLDTLNIAERKATRENVQMKSMKPEMFEEALAQQQEQLAQYMAQTGEQIDPASLPAPLIIQVADFDVHEAHIETHNKFRMSQEYELLSDEIKDQFEQHVMKHKEYVMEEEARQMFAAGGTNGPMTPEEGMPQMPGMGGPEEMQDGSVQEEGAPGAPGMEGL